MIKAKYRVVINEYERGFGVKYYTHKDFDSKKEADTYYKEYNAQALNKFELVPDWYTKAEKPELVEI